MNHSIKVGLNFGCTSGVITTLGLMVGLHAGTQSRLAVLGGIITIAIADAFSDALGIHVSEESENIHSPKEIWQSTLTTFSSKLIFSSLFIIPVLLMDLKKAIVISLVLGYIILGISSYYLAKEQKIHPCKVMFEHLLIATIVIILTHLIGDWVSLNLGT